ncbi:AhpC-TSA-domain-containing protein [Xylariaceae sp. FL0255]|nr:AhpC-TSA-domain-containing protein [Xylariaceae sp. FL0255]
MPVELRKRKAPAPAPEPPAKKQSTVSKAATKVKEAVKGKSAPAAKPTNGSAKAPVVGGTISLDGFGAEIETQDGTKTTLKALVDESKAGVVLFTYPKASTPGCTKQACMFRDSYVELTKGGLAIYGLSTDSPKSNTAFKTKQNLPYPLLCDPDATLIGAIGLKKAPKGTMRGVFVIDKTGKVLVAEAGSPAGTVETVQKLVAAAAEGSAKEEEEPAAEEKEATANGDAAKEEEGKEKAEESAEKKADE